VLATLSQAWSALLIAGAALVLVVLANCAVHRTVRRHERLVRVLAAMAMTVVTVIGLSFVLVIGGLGVLTALCLPNAFECPA
jgi:hypothetical protein